MAERPIDELKIKISVDESGSVSKSLDDIIAKLEKIKGVGGGKADQFTDLLTTLSNMDSSLSKISGSLAKVSSGISKIAKATEGWGGKFSSDLKTIDKGMQNISGAADKMRESTKKMADESNITKQFDMTKPLTQLEEYELRVQSLQSKLAKEQSLGDAADGEKIANINKRLRTAEETLARYNAQQEEARIKAQEAFAAITQMAEQSASKILMLTDGSERLQNSFTTAKITDYLDGTAITTVTEGIDGMGDSLTSATEKAEALKTVLEETSEVSAPWHQYDTEDARAHMEKFMGTIDNTVTEAERLKAIRLSNMITDAELAKTKYNELADTFARMLKHAQSSGEPLTGKKLAKIVGELRRAKAEMERLTGAATTLNTTSPFERLSSGALSAAKNFAKAHFNLKKMQKTFSGAGSLLLSNPFSGMANAITNVSKKLKGLGKSFLRTARMRMFRYMIRSITAGLKEGVDNAYEWSRLMDGRMPSFAESMDKVATATQYLKNSLGALVTPIINAVAPAFDFLIDKVVAFINIINQLIARLTGATMWTRAVKNAKQYKDSLDSAASSAGKLAEELITILGIDEINPMASDKGSGGAGGSGASDGADYGAMFVNEALGEMSGRMSEMFEPFEKAWASKGATVVKSIERTFVNLKTLISTIGDSFWAVWTNGTGQKTVETILGIFTGISDTIGNIAKQLEKGWKTDNLGTQIIQNLWNTLNSLLGMWERITTSTAEWAETLDFTPLLKGVENFTDKFSKLYDKVADFGADVWEGAVLPFAKWVVEDIAPVALDAIAEAIGVVTEAWKLVEPGLKWLWDNILSPSLGTVGTAVKDALELIRDILKTIKEYLQDINDLINGNKTLKEFLEQGAKNTPGETTPERVSQKEDWQSVGTTTGTTADSLGQYIYDKYDKNPVQIKAEVLGERYTQQFDDPTTNTTAKATIFEDKTPKGSRIIADVLARANALDTVGMPAGKKIVNGVTGGISGLKDSMTSDKRYLPGLLGGVSALKNQLTPQQQTIGLEGWINKLFESSAINDKKWLYMEGWVNKLFEAAALKNNKWLYLQGWINELHESRLIDDEKWLYLTGWINQLQKTENAKLVLTGTLTDSGSKSNKANFVFAKNGGIFSRGFWRSVPQYAGGSLNAGTAFIAGEAGPEIVGHVNGKTEVLNQSHIAQAMAQSMEAASAGQNRLLQEQNTLLRELIQKQGSNRNYVTSGDIIDGLQQRNRRDGRTVVAIGV